MELSHEITVFNGDGERVKVWFSLTVKEAKCRPDYKDFIAWVNKRSQQYSDIPFPRWQYAYRSFLQRSSELRHPTNDNRDYYRKTYLKSDHWKELRARKINGHKVCQVCGNMRPLDCHHIRYRNLYDVDPKDLIVLCRPCHDEIHSKAEGQKLKGFALEVFLEAELRKMIERKSSVKLENKYQSGKMFAALRRAGLV